MSDIKDLAEEMRKSLPPNTKLEYYHFPDDNMIYIIPVQNNKPVKIIFETLDKR